MLNQLSEFERELMEALEAVLWRMREICAEQGVMKKLPKKQRAKLYFSLRDGSLHSDYEFLGNCIGLTDLHSDYGEIIGLNITETEGLPASWLWTKNWEQKFIEEWIGAWQEEKLKDEIAQEKDDRAQFECLKKKLKVKR